MKKTRRPEKPVSADAIARLAEKGQDVSDSFKGEGRMVPPTPRKLPTETSFGFDEDQFVPDEVQLLRTRTDGRVASSSAETSKHSCD